MDFEDVLTLCIEKWRGEGIALAPPVDEAEVRSVWECLGGRTSEDVVRLYTTIGGFAEDDYDSTLFWSLWPWDMIRQENLGRRGEGVLFCDHSIRVIDWEIRFEDDRRSSVWQVTDSSMTAPSLESFFRLYLEDPWQLLHAWSPPDGDPCKKQGSKRGGPFADKSDPLWDETLDG